MKAEEPIFEHPRYVSLKARTSVEEEIGGLLKQGQVRLSTSPWNAPIVLVKRKDGRLRLCVDYRRLNKTSNFNYFPLPRIEEIIYECAGADIFSTLESSIEKTLRMAHNAIWTLWSPGNVPEHADKS